MKLLLRFKVFATSILITGSVSAQEAETKRADSTRYLDQVTISALRGNNIRRNTAQQFQSLTYRDIKFLTPQTTADVVAQTGTVSVQKSQQGGGSPVIRGFEASRILLVVDGVRMNNLIYRAGHLQNILTIDNNSLERLEILSGPSSSMYGSDALGGVIVMNTMSPEFSSTDTSILVKGNALFRYATANNESTGHIDFKIGGKKFASFTSATYSSFDDLKGGKEKNWFHHEEYGNRDHYVERIEGVDSLLINPDTEKQIQSAFNQFDLIQKFSYSTNQNIVHQLNIQYSTSSDIPRYDRLTDPGNNGGLAYSEWYYGPQDRLMAAYALNINRKKAWMDEFRLTTAWQSIEESRHTRRFKNNNLQHRTENVMVASLNADIHKILSEQHDIRYGVEVQYNSLESTANQENIVSGASSPLSTRYPDGDNTMTLASAYIAHNWAIDDKIQLVEGVRIGYSMLKSEFIDTTFYPFPFNTIEQQSEQIAFNAGVIFKPTSEWKTSLLFSTGYRVPNVDDLAKVFESGNGILITPNPDLKPEKTYNGEVSVTWEPNKTFSWENNFYYTLFRDAIVTAPYKFNGQDSIMYDGSMSKVMANQNMREAFIYGFSTAAGLNAGEYWNVKATATYTYGRIDTDTSDAPLDHIPPFMARLQCTYTKNKFRGDLIGQYNSWKKIEDYYLNGEDNEQYATIEGMPAWIVFNARLSYQLHKNLMLQAGCDNLFDMQYRVFASGINAPGRNFMLSLRMAL